MSSTTTGSSTVTKSMDQKRATFIVTYRCHHAWPIPDSVIYYMTKNPSTVKCYQKIVQTCKYFFIKNPILVIQDLSFKYIGGKENIFVNETVSSNLSCKIWITDQIIIFNNEPANQYSFSTCVPKIYQSDIKSLAICRQDISFTNLKLLVTRCKDVLLHEITVTNNDGSVIPLEDIIEIFPNATNIHYNIDGNASKIITPKTVQNLLKLQNFFNLTSFHLRDIPESFDIKAFYGHIKKNKKTKILLSFCDHISNEYRNQLRKIVDEIIQTKGQDYRPSLIIFPGLQNFIYRKLRKLFDKY